MPKKLNTKEFISKALNVHGHRYDYSKVKYVDATYKVEIICSLHGGFTQSPGNHLFGQGCPVCAGKYKRDTEWFITEARKVNGERYDYSKVKFTYMDEKVTIICHDHGPFIQDPYHHLYRKSNCPECQGLRKRTTQTFIKRAQEVHGDYYDYYTTTYINDRTKLTIGCPKHGLFQHTPNKHLAGQKCPKCAVELQHEQQRKSTNEFKAEARKIHGRLYDYSQVRYKNNRTPVAIVCAKHGKFQQTPEKHLVGQGCPDCAEYGFNPKKPAFIYYLRIETPIRKKPLYKIGITNNRIGSRIKSMGVNKDVNITILYKRRYTTGTSARRRERQILEENLKYRYRGKVVLESGYTEIFTRDVLGKDA